MALANPWGWLNPNVSDLPNDPSNDLGQGYQASCGGRANPEPLDYYLNQVGQSIIALEGGGGGGGGGGAGSSVVTNSAPSLTVTQAGTVFTVDLDVPQLITTILASPALIQQIAAGIAANPVAMSSIWGAIWGTQITDNGTDVSFDGNINGNTGN